VAYALSDTKDGISFTGGRTANSPVFTLLGGRYMYAMTAASGSSVLNMQMPDGSYIAVGASTTLTTSAGNATVDLPGGTYEVVLVATADVAGFVQRVPYLPAY